MPQLSVIFIKTSLIYLVAGFTFGGLILFQKGAEVFPLAWLLLPGHIEVLFFGWTLQLIMGTAFWILPRFGSEPRRGDERPVRLSYGFLNLGILLALFSPLLPGATWFFFAGRVAEAIGLGAFIGNVWPRVKPFAARR